MLKPAAESTSEIYTCTAAITRQLQLLVMSTGTIHWLTTSESNHKIWLAIHPLVCLLQPVSRSQSMCHSICCNNRKHEHPNILLATNNSFN